ncbi:hypothetical protein C8J57DRAFT_1598785 [Mycena rebaudengoi]|nr:hypothetical protein C8J57DRAFT_1598785 [Mycena rebaudengoi]
MSLSVLEAMSILRPMEQNLARLGLPAYSRSNDDDETDGKVWQKWLDSLASLLVGSSPGSLSNQSRCIVTIAFNVRSTRSGDVHKLVHSIWNWMKDASVLPEEDSKKNGELFGIILEASLDRIRRRLKDKGKFVGPLIAKAEETNLTELQKTFLMTAYLLHVDILQRLGPDVEKPDFHMASKAFRFRVKAYEAAKSKLEDFYWLHPFESQMVKCTSSALQDLKRPSHTKFAAEAKLPSLVCYVDKLQKPYSQYVLICKAVRKSFIRDTLSIPLHVNVLPSGKPSLGNFPGMSGNQDPHLEFDGIPSCHLLVINLTARQIAVLSFLTGTRVARQTTSFRMSTTAPDTPCSYAHSMFGSELCPTRHAPAPLLDHAPCRSQRSQGWSACSTADEPRSVPTSCSPATHAVPITIVWAGMSSCPPNRLRRPHRSSIGFASYSASSHKHCRQAPIDAPVPDLGALQVIELFVMLHMIPAPYQFIGVWFEHVPIDRLYTTV